MDGAAAVSERKDEGREAEVLGLGEDWDGLPEDARPLPVYVFASDCLAAIIASFFSLTSAARFSAAETIALPAPPLREVFAA